MSRRFIFSGKLEDIESIKTDVAIVGSGAAGLFTALHLDPRLDCIVLNKMGPEICNSMYAQGGIAVVLGQSIGDSTDKHYEDTLVAGAGLCDKQAVRVLVDEGEDCIRDCIEFGVPFDRKNGLISLGREGGHSEFRIVHIGGDASGLHLTRQLYAVASEQKNIRIIHNMLLSDILKNENGVVGILVMDETGKTIHIQCQRVVLATGGIGRVYRNSTNAASATGDGIAAATRADVVVEDMEFVQFHPTGLLHPDNTGRYFLISEALRGEGAILRNRNREAFMQGKHPMADLAPRDIVSRAIIHEMMQKNLPHVYLDSTSIPRAELQSHFPTIYGECMRRGIDIAINWIPVIPVHHYFMGGVKTDLHARTNLNGLYACGETARTGVHGANRLASNSLLECLVFGKRCAQDINDNIDSFGDENDYVQNKSDIFAEEFDLDTFITEMRDVMTRKCGIIREEKSMQEAAERIGQLHDVLNGAELLDKKAIETFNIASVASEILTAARARKHSVGAHYRNDDMGGQ